MGKLIKGTNHVCIRANSEEQFDEAIHFYRDLLGLEVLRAWGEGRGRVINFWTGNGIVEMFCDGVEGRTTGCVDHFALSTDDVDLCVETVRKAGYEITKEPRDEDVPTDPVWKLRWAFCVGPTGESIEFFQEK